MNMPVLVAHMVQIVPLSVNVRIVESVIMSPEVVIVFQDSQELIAQNRVPLVSTDRIVVLSANVATGESVARMMVSVRVHLDI